MDKLTKCPTCSPSLHPGYLPNGHRCETCKGRGVARLIDIMGWELSL